MFILRNILTPLQDQFRPSRKGTERGVWFVYTLLAIITHFTSSCTSSLLRCLQTLFELPVSQRRFYTFMASSKLPWQSLWAKLWFIILEPAVNGRLLLALDDFINSITGKKILGSAYIFDHAAKINQSNYAWAQRNDRRQGQIITYSIDLIPNLLILYDETP